MFHFLALTNIFLSYPDIQAAGHILQALEIIRRPTKDPKSLVPERPKSLVLQYFGDNLDEEHAHCTLSYFFIFRPPNYLGYKQNIFWGREVFHKSKLIHLLHLI